MASGPWFSELSLHVMSDADDGTSFNHIQHHHCWPLIFMFRVFASDLVADVMRLFL